MTLQQLCEQAVGLHQQGRAGEAEALYLQVLAGEPRNFTANHMLGLIRSAQGRHAEALELIGMALKINPYQPAALSNQGLVLAELGRADEALASFDKALTINPRFAQALHNRAVILQDHERFEESLACYDRLLAATPASVLVLHNRGIVLSRLSRFEDAAASFDKVLTLQPDFAEARNNRGSALMNLTRFAEALADFDAALAAAPDFVPALYNRANILKTLEQFEAALADYAKVLTAWPQSGEAWLNQAGTLSELKRYAEAAASYARAADLNTQRAIALRNQALCHLTLGQFETAWPLYEWRKWRGADFVFPDHPRPLWLGDTEISGKTLFVYWEQGLGDTIQFSRYARLCAARGARVILAVPDSLRELLQQQDPAIEMIGATDVPEEFDFHCPLLSLPLAFRTSLASIPAQQPLLAAADATRQAWAARLGPRTRPRIGLVWSGGPSYVADRQRSLDPERLLPLLQPEFDWYCLQKDVKPADQALLEKAGVGFFSDALGDLSQTAALLDGMDLVITVDTAVAHLAGAMGKPVWVLLPYNSDWRWLMNRDDSPWYPSAKLFRQERRGDWTGLVERVQKALAGWSA